MNVGAVILSGGQATRMGGLDKGLQSWKGQRLIDSVLWVTKPAIWRGVSANRNLDVYAQLADSVWQDDAAWQGQGPLAGIASFRLPESIDWTLVVPCDTPALPDRIIPIFQDAQSQSPEILAWYAQVRQPGQAPMAHPSVMFLSRAAWDSAPAYLAQTARRSILAWLMHIQARPCVFHDADEFININTLEA